MGSNIIPLGINPAWTKKEEKVEAKYPEITLGESICEKLKIIFFPDKRWQQCYKDVAIKFTALKEIAKKFYTDKDILAILIELNKYSTQDIQEAFHMELNQTSKDANHGRENRLSVTVTQIPSEIS